jgi:hypothetical protein
MKQTIFAALLALTIYSCGNSSNDSAAGGTGGSEPTSTSAGTDPAGSAGRNDTIPNPSTGGESGSSNSGSSTTPAQDTALGSGSASVSGGNSGSTSGSASTGASAGSSSGSATGSGSSVNQSRTGTGDSGTNRKGKRGQKDSAGISGQRNQR